MLVSIGTLRYVDRLTCCTNPAWDAWYARRLSYRLPQRRFVLWKSWNNFLVSTDRLVLLEPADMRRLSSSPWFAFFEAATRGFYFEATSACSRSAPWRQNVSLACFALNTGAWGQLRGESGRAGFDACLLPEVPKNSAHTCRIRHYLCTNTCFAQELSRNIKLWVLS